MSGLSPKNSFIETKKPAEMDLTGITWKKDGPKYWETRSRSPKKDKEYNTDDMLLNVTI
tara:strand:+ start:67 stop:243 length:177 start_codon:yes stop_codon:yes gene_type:complete